MADDIRLAGVKFVTEDFAMFKRNMQSANREIQELNDNLRNLKSVSGTFKNLFGGTRSSVRNLESSLKTLNTQTGKVRTGSDNLGKSFRSSRRDFLAWASDLSVVRFGIEAVIGDLMRLTGIVAGVPAEFESAFIGIAKTVDGLGGVSEEGLFELTEEGRILKETLKDLSENEIPATFQELAKFGELGGQFGITQLAEDSDEAREILESFITTVAGLDEATDVEGEVAALQLSQIVQLFKDDVDGIADTYEGLGNVVVRLGNETATTESQILNMARRIANAASIVGFTVDEVFGLSAAISEAGLTAEAGGTAASNGLLLLNSALVGSKEAVLDNSEEIDEYSDKLLDLNAKLVRLEYQTGVSGASMIELRDEFLAGGGSVEEFGRQLGDSRRQQLFRTQEQINELTGELAKFREENGKVVAVTEDTLKIFAEVAGLSVPDFRLLAEEDASAAFEAFIVGLGEIDEAGGDAVKILNDLGIGSEQAERTFLSLARTSATLQEKFKAANEEFENGSALADEVEKRYASLDSQFQLFLNTVNNTIDDLFYGLIPTFVDLLGVVGEVVDIVGKRGPDSFRLFMDAIEPLRDLDLGITFDPVELTVRGFDSLDESLKGLDTEPLKLLIEDIQTLGSDVKLGVTESIDDLKVSVVELLETQTISNLIVELGKLKELADVEIEFDLSKLLTSVATFPIDTLTGTIELLTQIITLIESLNAQDTEGFNNSVGSIADTLQEKLIRPFETLDIIFPELDLAEKIKTAFESLDIPEIDLSIPVLPQLEIGDVNLKEIVDAIDITVSDDAAIALKNLSDVAGPFATETLPDLITNIGLLVGSLLTLENLEAIGDSGVPQRIVDILTGLTELSFDELRIGVEVLSSLNDVLTGLNTANQALVDSGLEDIKTLLIEGLANPLETLSSVLLEVDTNYTEPLQELVTSLTNLFEALEELDSGSQPITLEPQIEGFKQFLAALGPSFIEQLTATTDVITTFLNTINSVEEGLSTGDYSKIKENGKLFFEAVDSFFVADEAIDDILPDLSKIENAIADINSIQDLLNAIAVDPLEMTIGQLITLPTEEQIRLFMSDLALDIAQGLLDAIATTQNLSAQVVTIGQLLNLPTKEDVRNSIIQLTTDIFSAFQEELNKLVNLSPVSLDFGKLIEVQGIDTFADKIRNALAGIDLFGVTPFEDLAAPDIGDADFTDLTEQFGDAPHLMADSYEQGMDEADKTFVERTSDTGRKIKKAILEVLGFQSPSQFFIDIGKDIIKSIAIGIGDLSPILESFGIAVSEELIPISLEWDETNTQIHDNLNSNMIPAVENTIQIIEELIGIVESADSSMRNWSGTITGTLIPALKLAQDQLNLIETKSEDVIELIDKLTESYLALAAAIIAANNAGSVNAPTTTAPGQAPSPGPGATPFQTGGSFLVPNAIPQQLRGATGGMNIEVHPGELVQVMNRAMTNQMLNRPTNISNIVGDTRMPTISGQNISNMTNTTNNNQRQDLHLHIAEAPSGDVQDSFDLLRVLRGN